MVFKLMAKNVYLLCDAELQVMGRILRKHAFIPSWENFLTT